MFHPPLFSLVINVLRPAPVLPLVIHSREIGARILGITIVIHSIDRIMRAAGLIDSMLILPVDRLHASINAHMTLFSRILCILLENLHAYLKSVIPAKRCNRTLFGQVAIVFRCASFTTLLIACKIRIVRTINDFLGFIIATATILPSIVTIAFEVADILIHGQISAGSTGISVATSTASAGLCGIKILGHASTALPYGTRTKTVPPGFLRRLTVSFVGMLQTYIVAIIFLSFE